jgi:hypothetical protein
MERVMKKLSICTVSAITLMLSGLLFTVGCGGSDDSAPAATAETAATGGNGGTPASDGGDSSSPEISMSVVSSVNDGAETTATLMMSGVNIVKGTFVDFKWESADFSSTIGPDSTTAGADGMVTITIMGSFPAVAATTGMGVVTLQRDTTADGIYDEILGPYEKSLVL